MNLNDQYVALRMVLLLSISTPTLALESDAEQPIEITADQMTLDDSQDIGHYRGNVVLTQGSIRITGEQVTVHLKDGILEYLEVTGDSTAQTQDTRRASYRQLTDQREEALGYAERIEYYAQQARVLMLQQAELSRGSKHIASDRIEYNTRTDRLAAGNTAGNQPDDRVRIIIQPNPATP